MISNHPQLRNTHNHRPNNHSINPVMESGKRMHPLMEVISGPLKVGIGLTTKIRHINTLKITVMMVRDEEDTEDEVVAVDLQEEDSEVVEVVEITRMATEAVTMVVVVGDIEEIEEDVAVTWTVVVVMDTEVREVAVVVVSEVKMDPVEEDLEADVVVTEVTVVMVDITEGSEACPSINNRCV